MAGPLHSPARSCCAHLSKTKHLQDSGVDAEGKLKPHPWLSCYWQLLNWESVFLMGVSPGGLITLHQRGLTPMCMWAALTGFGELWKTEGLGRWEHEIGKEILGEFQEDEYDWKTSYMYLNFSKNKLKYIQKEERQLGRTTKWFFGVQMGRDIWNLCACYLIKANVNSSLLFTLSHRKTILFYSYLGKAVVKLTSPLNTEVEERLVTIF